MEVKTIPNVWVIDDDPLQVLILNRFLTTHQAVQSIKFFSGSKPAIARLAAHKADHRQLPDLVFLDLIMTRGDGWEFLEQCKKMRARFSNMPKVIVISSYSEENYARLKQYPEVISYVQKPMDKKRFDEALNSFFTETKKDIS